MFIEYVEGKYCKDIQYIPHSFQPPLTQHTLNQIYLMTLSPCKFVCHIWSHLSLLVTTGHSCHLVTSTSHIWSHLLLLVTSGNTWSHLVTPDHIWSQLDTPFRSFTPGHLRFCLVTPVMSCHICNSWSHLSLLFKSDLTCHIWSHMVTTYHT